MQAVFKGEGRRGRWEGDSNLEDLAFARGGSWLASVGVKEGWVFGY